MCFGIISTYWESDQSVRWGTTTKAWATVDDAGFVAQPVPMNTKVKQMKTKNRIKVA
jgi:hypothetical protein